MLRFAALSANRRLFGALSERRCGSGVGRKLQDTRGRTGRGAAANGRAQRDRDCEGSPVTAKEPDKCCGNKPELGCKDELGLCVIEIYSDGGDWVVYRNSKNVRVWTDHNSVLASEALAQVGVDLAKIESNMYFFEERAPETSKSANRRRWERQRQSVYALVAKSLTLRLTKHAEQAATVMKLADSLLSTFVWRANIVGYLVGAGGATFVFLVVALAALYMRGWEWAGVGIYSVFVFATLGGFLSVLSGIRGLRPALQGQHYLNVLSGVIRIAIAVISGVLVYVAIKGGILPLAHAASGEDLPFRLWFLLAAAGFFEKLVPDILGRETERRTGQ